MTTEIDAIRAAILEDASPDDIGTLPLPESFRAAVVRADESEMFAGLPSEEKDPRKSTHVEEVPLPELAPDEAYVAVMASAINFNTVWTSIFEPLPTFQFLQRLGKESVWAKRHGASNPTTAVWLRSRSCAQTSSCPNPPISRGRRQPATRCATRRATA